MGYAFGASADHRRLRRRAALFVRDLHRRSVGVAGRLVDWETAHPWTVGGPSSSGGRDSFRAVVAFAAGDGSEHRVKSALWRQAYQKPKIPMGSPFPVRYDPHNPGDARIATLMEYGSFRFSAWRSAACSWQMRCPTHEARTGGPGARPAVEEWLAPSGGFRLRDVPVQCPDCGSSGTAAVGTSLDCGRVTSQRRKEPQR